MKLIPVIAAFALATLMACGSDNKIYTLSSGVYVLSNTSAVAPDQCNLGTTLPDNTRINLTVSASSVTFIFGGTPNSARDPVASIQGNTIGTASKTFDFDNNTLTPPRNFNCVETDTITVNNGSLLANDQLNANISLLATPRAQNPGNQCGTAYLPNLGYKQFPCSSTMTFIAKKM
jgi:hypothetical protein